MGTTGWFQRSGSSSFEFLLAEGDSVERCDCNVLQGTICLQLSSAFQFYCYVPFTEVESSGTHFEVLSLRASSLRKLPCPRLEDSSIFGILKILYIIFCRKICFFGDFLILFFCDHLKKILKAFFLKRVKKIFEDIIFFFENTCACVLALERVCP